MRLKLTGNRNQCPSCALYFNSTFSFDRHRVGAIGRDRRCLGIREMLEIGMATNRAGFWVTKPMKPSAVTRIAA
jgi:hypothetical protein